MYKKGVDATVMPRFWGLSYDALMFINVDLGVLPT